MGLFKKKKQSAFGLDIGHSSVKGVEVTRSGNDLVVTHFGCVPIEDAGKGKRAEAVVSAIKRLCSDAGFSTKRTITAVSGESVIVRVLRLPYFSDKETEELRFAVESEARDFIPFDMEDVAFDYQKLAEIDAGSEGRALDVLIVAAQKDVVKWHTDVVQAAGLDPRVIDIGSFALINAVHYGANLVPETPVALVDIGSAVTNIAIMKGEHTRFTRDLSTAGNTITRAIVAELGLDEAQAEKAKRDFGISFESDSNGEEEILTISQSNLPEMFDNLGVEGDPLNQSGRSSMEQQVHAICEQFLGEIVSEIKRCLLFYENQLDGEPVGKVFLTGGTVCMKNSDRYIENLLDTPTEILDPFKAVKGDILSIDPLERGAKYTVGLGLAMRSVIGGGVS